MRASMFDRLTKLGREHASPPKTYGVHRRAVRTTRTLLWARPTLTNLGSTRELPVERACREDSGKHPGVAVRPFLEAVSTRGLLILPAWLSSASRTSNRVACRVVPFHAPTTAPTRHPGVTATYPRQLDAWAKVLVALGPSGAPRQSAMPRPALTADRRSRPLAERAAAAVDGLAGPPFTDADAPALQFPRPFSRPAIRRVSTALGYRHQLATHAIFSADLLAGPGR